ncbi:MAG: 16S rRNA (guanine(966)-N(2))-methyltransferase RsmD [Rhizobiaceae bacterium]|jgi:16S rRNA (guanine966-N2)-methyltransferase|nr:16S rRNA (guanine(966)-N(2))-methyltransferase RsmD [Rhizobiaceae bacterium]
MRIVAGDLRGRALLTPSTPAIRPTGDRTREALFNILESRWQACAGARVLDLFAGTGALGIEALSRGAAHCCFVEEGVEGRGLIRGNIEAFGLTGRTRLLRRDATDMGPVGNLAPFTLVFADPPYGRGLGEKAFSSTASGGWIAPGAICVLEEAASAAFQCPPCFALEDERRYGDTVLRFLLRT